MNLLKKTLIVCLMTSIFLSGCSYEIPGVWPPYAYTSKEGSVEEKGKENTEGSSEISGDTVSSDSTKEAAEDVSSIDTSVMKPWINSNIMGIVTDDVNADLKDDFYLSVNHDYLRDAKLRPGYPIEMTIYDAIKIVKDRCTEILTDKTLEGRDAELTQGLYELFLDWDKRNEIGFTKVEPVIKQLEEVSTIEELNDFLMTDEWLYMGIYPCNVNIEFNKDDSSLYQVGIVSSPLSLGDPAEYEQLTVNGEHMKEFCDEAAGYMLARLGYSEEEIQKVLDESFSFETKLAGFMKTSIEWSDPASVKEAINMVTLDDIKEMSPNYPLVRHLELLGYEKSKLINISEPKWLEGLNELYNEDNLEEIKAYLITNTVGSLMTVLDEETYRAYQGYEMKLKGITEAASDEDAAYRVVMGSLRDNISRIYIEKYLNPEIKEEITALCQECIDTYSEMIDGEDWLSKETREEAKNKLSKIDIHAVYPEKWEDDSMLKITPKEEGGDYYSAIIEITKAQREKAKGYINAKVDKEIWNVNILDTNAYYNPSNNSINIIPGFFCDTTYRSDMSIEEKYGALGSVIGHEISHAFDTNGAQYDADGNIKDWWTEEDYAAFTERAEKLIEYYDKIVPLDDGKNYQGQMVQTEAIADMAGLKCMLLMASKIDGFDYDKFFRTYTHLWASVGTLSEIQKRVYTDEHPLFYLRGNVSVQQFDEFLETYDIKEGDGMYLAPEDRIMVW